MKRLLAILFVWMMVPAMGMADEASCNSDADCPEDFYCMAPLCACAEPEGGEAECFCGTGYCMDMKDDEGPVDDIYFESECETDADCPADFRCEEISWACAATPSCPPCICEGCDPDDGECDPTCECPPCDDYEDDFECEGGSTTMCVYTPVECESDVDCAAGFECETFTWGSSGGSSGGGTACVCAPCPDGEERCECDCDDMEEPVWEEIEEEEIVEEEFGICVPAMVVCESTSDCLEGWDCIAFPGDCMCTACLCVEGMEEDCECEQEDECTCEDGENYCVPEGWDQVAAAANETWGDSESGGAMLPMMAGGEGAVRKEQADEDGTVDETINDGTGAEEGGSSGGCTSAGTSAGTNGLFLLFLLASLLVVAVRRQTVRVR